MVKAVHDKEEQAEQNRNGTRQDYVAARAVQSHEAGEPDQQHAAEYQPAPEQPRNPWLCIKDAGVALRSQDGELAEELAVDRRGTGLGLLTSENAVHV